MNCRNVTGWLSAYIDGECPAAGRVARHLQSCPECARHHMQLLKVAGHIRNIPGPTGSREFADRVMARIHAGETAGSRPARFGAMSKRLGWGLAALLAVVGLGIALTVTFDESEPARHAADTPPAYRLLEDEAARMAATQLLEAGVWPDPLMTDVDLEPDAPAPTVGELVDALAAWTDYVADEDWYAEEDFPALMDALAREDVEALAALWQTYSDEV